MYKPYSGYKPIQYATVWNDATPAIYMEVERSASKCIFNRYMMINIYIPTL